jgi:hypothetical protein
MLSANVAPSVRRFVNFTNHPEMWVVKDLIGISNGNLSLNGWDSNVIPLVQLGSKLLLVGGVCIVHYEQK